MYLTFAHLRKCKNVKPILTSQCDIDMAQADVYGEPAVEPLGGESAVCSSSNTRARHVPRRAVLTHCNATQIYKIKKF